MNEAVEEKCGDESLAISKRITKITRMRETVQIPKGKTISLLLLGIYHSIPTFLGNQESLRILIIWCAKKVDHQGKVIPDKL